MEKVTLSNINVEIELERFTRRMKARICFLRDFSDYVHSADIKGNVAECGVFKGDFAYFINKYFYDRKFCLFDSFEGFRQMDVNTSLALNDKIFEKSAFNQSELFSNTSEGFVMKKMLFPEMCEIHKGYIPESADGFQDEFCFVNLDMDLYKPMFEALKIFYPMVVKRGVILLHDYFSPPSLSKSVQTAVADFEKIIGYELPKVPIGDFASIAIIKT